MSNVNSIKLGSVTYPITAQGIFIGNVTSNSTTVFTADVTGVTEYFDGLVCYIKNNGNQTSASGWTLDVNGLGAKPVYQTMAASSLIAKEFNKNYTGLFIYNTSRVATGCWDWYWGYNTNTDTIGYSLRTNYTLRPAADTGYRYRLWFTSVSGASWVPANTSTATNATSSRTPNSRPIDPFGEIIYCSTNGGTTTSDPVVTSGNNLPATTCWQEYGGIALGYSFNTTGKTLVLSYPAPVYIQCTPQSGGGAVMNGYTQTLPNIADGKIYIFLGMAYSATAIELAEVHPVYHYVDGKICLYTGNTIGNISIDNAATATFSAPNAQTVTINRALTSGTAIATITINGTAKTLYAPTPTTDTDIDTKYTYSANVSSGTKLGTVVGQTFTKGSGGSTFTAYEIYAPAAPTPTDYGFTSINNLTVPTSGWNGSAPSATINITVTGVNSSSHGFLGIDGSKVTSAQFNEAMKSNIVVSGIGSNYITLKALRKVPELTIPVILEVQKNS